MVDPRGGFQRLRFQDPGQHEPGPPRPDRLFPHLLRQVHPGHEGRHHRLGKEINLANATIFMAQERSHVDEAWPGDIIGLHNHGTIKIGDTFSPRKSSSSPASPTSPRNISGGCSCATH
jgi:hypothetical protein